MGGGASRGTGRTALPALRLACLLVALFSAALSAGAEDRTPGAFLENRGQLDAAVRYYEIGSPGSVYFTAEGPVLSLRGSSEGTVLPRRARERRFPVAEQRYAVKIRPAGPDPAASIEGRERLPAHHAYLLGSDRQRFHSDVRSFAAVVYRGVRPGVDLVYRLRGGVLTYEVVVDPGDLRNPGGPGAGPERLRFEYDGAATVEETSTGTRIATPLGTLLDRPPGGRAGIGSISLLPVERAAEPDAGAAPREQTESGLRFGTFLGGQTDDVVYSVDLDDQMRPVVTGATRSADFPTSVGAVDPSYAGSYDVFVSKLDADGQTLLWSTFLGSDGDDRGWVVRLDGAGRPVIAGVTSSTTFPTTSGAFDTTHNGSYDAFVAKLSADGSSVVWSTFVGGSAREWDVSGLALDGAGRPVLVGSTRSSDFPTSAGAYDDALSGTADGFVALLAEDGGSLAFGTYLGGSEFDAAEGVAVDALGRAVVVGWTYSDDFPVSAQAFQSARAGTGSAQDGFVTKLASDGGSLVFSSYLGGDAADEAFAIDLAALDDVLVTGRTESTNFPTTAGSFEPGYTSSGDAFVARIAADGSSLLWSTFLGGSSIDSALAVVGDAWDQPVVAGWTCSSDLPTAGAAFDESFNGSCDGFVARFSADGASLRYGSYLGWWFDESAYGLAVDGAGRPVVGGETTSTGFPTTPGAYDTTHNGPDWYDGFVVSLLVPSYCTYLSGDGGSELTIERGDRASCAAGAPTTESYDVIEGRIDLLGPGDLGPVQQVACGAGSVVFATDTEPLPGQGLFQLARLDSGSYVDGGGAGQTGARVPHSGDCP